MTNELSLFVPLMTRRPNEPARLANGPASEPTAEG